MTERLLRHASGKVVLALEGGYNVRLTAECAQQCMRVLLGTPPPPLPMEGPTQPRKEAVAVLQAVTQMHAPFWCAMLQICYIVPSML